MSLPSKEPLAQVKMRKSLNMPTPPAFAALAAFDRSRRSHRTLLIQSPLRNVLCNGATTIRHKSC